MTVVDAAHGILFITVMVISVFVIQVIHFARNIEDYIEDPVD